MKTSSDRSVKSLKKSSKTGRTRKQSSTKYSAYIYKIEKELSVDVSDAISLMGRRADVHAQVGTEAARLSKFNRRRVITQREIHAAVHAHRGKPSE
ncbi:histone H2B.1, sperm-like [Rhinichthys klamathensis goyatoka]|uniref:histone H2B.1, sperm-like n=1 Tax=Rhinichthys klamathensis goyatoka TaxID=3034132 RepID=UPI0024B51540|nr:histone H2B.1, sperm-like [Rhinichthys klamathensis goyatoka]